MFSGPANEGLSPTAKPRVALFWTDYRVLVSKLPPGARKAIEGEVQAIFGEAGIQVSFHVGSPEDHEPIDAHEIRVILMPRSAEGWKLVDGAMGAILERAPRRATVYIFVPVVERTIGQSAERNEMIHDTRKAHALARALARVLAHEAVHAIDSDIPHGPEGSVMSANLTSEFLLGHRRSFDETTRKRLLESLFRPATARNPHP
jgi:hypothetical protein